MKRNSQTFSQIIVYSSFLKASNSTSLGIYLLAISSLGYKQQSLSNNKLQEKLLTLKSWTSFKRLASKECQNLVLFENKFK